MEVLIRVDSGFVDYNPRRNYCPLVPKWDTFNATKGSPQSGSSSVLKLVVVVNSTEVVSVGTRLRARALKISSF